MGQAQELAKKAAMIIVDETKKINKKTTLLNEKKMSMKESLTAFINSIMELSEKTDE